MDGNLETSDDFELAKAVENPSTGKFRGFFTSLEHSKERLARLLELHRKDERRCTFLATDPTFPNSDAAWVAMVRRVVEAISDWSKYLEWIQIVSIESRDQFLVQLQAQVAEANFIPGMREMRPSDDTLSKLLPSLEEQQRKILGSRPLSDLVVELIS